MAGIDAHGPLVIFDGKRAGFQDRLNGRVGIGQQVPSCLAAVGQALVQRVIGKTMSRIHGFEHGHVKVAHR